MRAEVDATIDEDRDLLGERPRDPIAERLVLQRLESKLLEHRPAAVMISRYVLLGRIGSGGLGAVYEAYDPQLDRKIAIKVLHDAGAAMGGTVRLLREGQALAKLAHPNVVAVHDVGVDDDGSFFIAMELVAGLTLAAWIAECPREWSELRDVMVQAGRGLLAAHEAGLVHRDFKPANVLVGSDGRVRVLDFGLARAVATADEGVHTSTSTLAQTVTAAGTLMGTPAYMAPEQIEHGEAGPRSDQFGFGVALYEALYGERPFRGDDVVQTLIAVRQCELPPAPAGTRVPAWLHRVVARALARVPADRFPDMGALLEAMVADRRSRRRQRVGAVLALALTAALAVGATLVLRPEPTPAEVELVDRLAGEARGAAARSYFVYPPVDDPEGATAYRKVRELETQAGAIDAVADARATELRAEFAATLVRLGDEYWAREGGVEFASDYYAAALVFDPEDAHARARTTLSPGELHALGDKAARGGFTTAELVAGESLAVLAESDPVKRRAKADALLQREGPAASTKARLRELVTVPAATASARVAATSPEPPRTPDAASPPVAAAVTTPSSEPSTAPPAKREDADALVAAAARESAAGRTSAAEELLHRALRSDRDHAEALAALAHIYFEAAQYHKALRFATRAVDAAPKRAAYRILLGDAHFRVLAYDAARVQYEAAAKLGHASAAKRIELLDERTGGGERK
jgi:tetratricopeptide (TPR) repeat protein